MAERHLGQSYDGNPAANYERYFVPAIGEPMAIDLLGAAELRAGERVLDVACGTGIVARLAAAQVGEAGKVAGLDLNPGMLAVARSTVPPDLAVEWHEASAEAMPFPDASFDVVLCQMGLQFMPDKAAALGEMRRSLASDGRLLFNVPGPTPRVFTILAEAFASHAAPQAAGFVNQVFSLHENDEVEQLVRGAGFRDVSVQSGTTTLRLPEPREFLWQYVGSTPLAAAVGQMDDARRDSLEREVVAKWGELVGDGALVLEVRAVVAAARK